MELSNRLKLIADMVRFDTVADIGTDHGYVPIYLHSKNRLKKGIACDINEGPLAKAKENIVANHAQNSIEVRLGNGLKPLAVGEVDSVVLAGMGGMLTIELLKACPQTVQGLKELILSPHLDWEAVRRFLHQIGFSIESEHMLKEAGKFYLVLRAVAQKEAEYDNPMEYRLGKKLLERKDPVLKEYVALEVQKMEAVKQRLVLQNSSAARVRLQEVDQDLTCWKEVLECLCAAKKL